MNISFVIPANPSYRNIGKSTLVQLLGIVGEHVLMIDEDGVTASHQGTKSRPCRSLDSAKNGLRGRRFDHIIVCRPTIQEAECVLKSEIVSNLLLITGGSDHRLIYTVDII